MVTKHFFKILTLFIVMIALGLLGVFLVNYFDLKKEQESEKADMAETSAKIKAPDAKVKTSTTSAIKIKPPVAK